MYGSKNTHRSRQDWKMPRPVYRNDGGSGLLKACKERFPAPEFEVTCDALGAVWVKRADDPRSFGLPPWLLRAQSEEEILANMERKLGLLREGRAQ